jgi:hypothetical protein
MATKRKKGIFRDLGIDDNNQREPSFTRGDGSDALGAKPGILDALGEVVNSLHPQATQPQQPEAVPAMAAPASGGMFRGLAPDGGPPIQTLGGMTQSPAPQGGPAPYPQLQGSLPALSIPDVSNQGFTARPTVGLQAAQPEEPQQTAQANQGPSSTDTYGKIMDLEQNYQDPHKHSLLGRLFKGLGKAWQQWDGQGGLVGLATTMLSGGIGSAVDPKNYAELEKRGEEQKLFRTLGIQQQREKWQADQNYNNSRAMNEYNQMTNRNVQTQLNISKFDRDKLNDAQKNMIDIWKASPSYKKGQDKGLDDRIAKAGLYLPDKEPNGRYVGSYAPDGTYRVLNTTTGESKDQGNYAKPTQLSEKELPDEMFGLMSDKEITDRAQAAVGKLPDDRKLKTDVTTRLPQFAAPDGTKVRIVPKSDKDKFEAAGDLENTPYYSF